MTDRDGSAPDGRPDDETDAADAETADLPEQVVDEAERLTRLAREAVDDEAAAYRDERADLLAEHDYIARVREDDTRDVLVCHPEEWVEDGLVQVEHIEDVDRGVERPLSGPGEGDDWAEVEAHNRAVVQQVAEEHGEVHAENARALARFMSDHYARPVESATAAEREEFLTEYFPRNAWPSDEQKERVEESVELAVAVGESVTGAAR